MGSGGEETVMIKIMSLIMIKSTRDHGIILSEPTFINWSLRENKKGGGQEKIIEALASCSVVKSIGLWTKGSGVQFQVRSIYLGCRFPISSHHV